MLNKQAEFEFMIGRLEELENTNADLREELMDKEPEEFNSGNDY